MHGAEGSDPGSVFDVVCQHVSQFTGMRLADIEAGRPPGAPEKDERLTLCALLELHDSLLGLVLAACDRRGIKQNTPSRDTDAPPSPRGSSTAKGGLRKSRSVSARRRALQNRPWRHRGRIGICSWSVFRRPSSIPRDAPKRLTMTSSLRCARCARRRHAA
eukprot:Polyplicarium_translucidae@DN3057_c0_g1_i2.p1